MDNSLNPSTNPFRELRLSDPEKLSQYELARRANVSKHAVLRLEQGMYPEPLPTLLNYFEENYHVSRLTLLQQYEAFQIAKRADTPRILGPNLGRLLVLSAEPGGWSPESHSSLAHPLVYLRSSVGLNPTSLAKALCISQTVVSFFEKRPITQKTVPEQLLNALKDNGYTDKELDHFKQAYKLFRHHLVAKEASLNEPETPKTSAPKTEKAQTL